MATPTREDWQDVVAALETRLDRAERTIKELHTRLGVADALIDPDAPLEGGYFYVIGGVPKFIGAGGTPQTISTT